MLPYRSFSIHLTGLNGLQVILPSPEVVKDLLEWFKMAPEHQIGFEPVRNRAINALIRLNGPVA